MGNNQYYQLVFRILLLVMNGIIIFYSYFNNYIINTIGFTLFFIFQLFTFVNYLKKQFDIIEKSIDCLLFDDYTNTISIEKRKNPLHYKTALLLEKQHNNHLKKTSEKLIFNNIIESLATGILILRKDGNQKIEVFQLNKAFIDFLRIPKYYNWQLLKPKLGTLTPLIDSWKKLRHTVTLTINDEKESFFLKTSVTQTNEYDYLVVSLETIQQLIDKKEKEAWYKLMNVMSHEIINTITPISSLAESLDSLLQENTDEDTLEELSEGLKIIKRRSSHLTSFVDTYRKLAELPLPTKKKTNIVTIVNNTLGLFEHEFSQKNINCAVTSEPSVTINADKQQIEQVLINLISNSIYAFKGVVAPKIDINISSEKNRILVAFTDNGNGIPEEIKHNIFIPYYTTRKNGSGIGLTLSKSIMEAHNGAIYYTKLNNGTRFTLVFMD